MSQKWMKDGGLVERIGLCLAEKGGSRKKREDLLPPILGRKVSEPQRFKGIGTQETKGIRKKGTNRTWIHKIKWPWWTSRKCKGKIMEKQQH